MYAETCTAYSMCIVQQFLLIWLTLASLANVAVYKIEDSHSMCAFWVSRRLHMLRFCSFYFLLYAFLRLLRTFYVRLCLHSYLHILLGLHTSLQLCTICKHFVCSACGRTLHCLCCVLHTDTFLGWKLVLRKKIWRKWANRKHGRQSDGLECAAWRLRPVAQCRQFQEDAKDASVLECTWTLNTLEALRNVLYKFKTYLLISNDYKTSVLTSL